MIKLIKESSEVHNANIKKIRQEAIEEGVRRSLYPRMQNIHKTLVKGNLERYIIDEKNEKLDLLLDNKGVKYNIEIKKLNNKGICKEVNDFLKEIFIKSPNEFFIYEYLMDVTDITNEGMKRGLIPPGSEHTLRLLEQVALIYSNEEVIELDNYGREKQLRARLLSYQQNDVGPDFCIRDDGKIFGGTICLGLNSKMYKFWRGLDKSDNFSIKIQENNKEILSERYPKYT